MSQVTTVIAEDEPLAREFLFDLVKADDRLRLIGMAQNGVEALKLLDQERPQLVLMDIRMPEMDGMDLLRASAYAPQVIFTTADATQASTAFDLDAVDYLLKPFGAARFSSAVDRLIRRLGEPTARPTRQTARVLVRHKGSIVPVRLDQVSRLEAQGDYVLLHAAGGPYWVSTSLSMIEAQLDSSRFLRVHRSHVVNLDYIARLDPHDVRRLLVVMQDGAEVVASREASQRLRSEVA